VGKTHFCFTPAGATFPAPAKLFPALPSPPKPSYRGHHRGAKLLPGAIIRGHRPTAVIASLSVEHALLAAAQFHKVLHRRRTEKQNRIRRPVSESLSFFYR